MPDFCFEVFKEKLPGNGEDSYVFSVHGGSCLVGVFDGCGGSGAKKYKRLRGKTGAYIASRVAAGTVRDWFWARLNEPGVTHEAVEQLKGDIKSNLRLCTEYGGGSTSFKGSLSKEFPTTAALLQTSSQRNTLTATCIWAGDSRCYLLDSGGLKQLTEDDLGGLDAMDNLTADGVLTNVITASKDFLLHRKEITISQPSILFAATDGCFGYYSTPMEFENLLLETLYSAGSITQWEGAISAELQQIAGDDYTLCGVAFGFGNMDGLKQGLEERYRDLYWSYIDGLPSKAQEEKRALWQRYKPDYAKYLIENAPR